MSGTSPGGFVPRPSSHERQVARQRAWEAYRIRQTPPDGALPLMREAFDSGWEAAMLAAYPIRYVLPAGEKVITREDVERLASEQQIIALPRPVLGAEQLREIGERILRNAGPLDVHLHVGKYVRNEVMQAVGRAFVELADEQDGQL